jgi:hypothetical protein
MIAAGEVRTRRELDQCCTKRHARPTGGSHGRTTDGPAQRFHDAKRRPRWWMMAQYNAANYTRIIKARTPRRMPRPKAVLTPPRSILFRTSGMAEALRVHPHELPADDV